MVRFDLNEIKLYFLGIVAVFALAACKPTETRNASIDILEKITKEPAFDSRDVAECNYYFANRVLLEQCGEVETMKAVLDDLISMYKENICIPE